MSDENGFDSLASEVVKRILDEYGVEPIDRELERLRAENAAMREIIEFVAGVPDVDYVEECPFCRQMPGYLDIVHTPECPVTKARALLDR